MRFLGALVAIAVIGCRTGGADEVVQVSDTTGAPAEAAPAMMVARGHEPGWIVTVTGDSIVYIGNYGQDTVTSRVTGVVTRDMTTTWSTAAGAGLTVAATRETCADGATGMPHPYAVSVAHDSATVRGCGGEPSSLLAGAPWTVRAINGDTVSGTAPTLQFDETGRVSGSTSCNQYSARYTIGGEGLTIGAVASTRRACDAPLMQLEQRFLQVLAVVARFEVATDGALRLVTNDAASIMARRD